MLSLIGLEACEQLGRDIIVKCEEAFKIIMKFSHKTLTEINHEQPFSSIESIFDHGS